MVSREDCLFYLRGKLWLKAARILADGDSFAAIGRMVERPGVLFDTGRRRWERFEKMIFSQELNQSSSRIIRSCKQDLSGRRQFVDFLVDDAALTWQWAASANHSFAKMETYRTALEQNYLPVRPLSESIFQDRAERVLDMLLRYPGEEGYKLINVLMYCLCRAQSLGELFEYALTYRVITNIAWLSRQKVVSIVREGNKRDAGRRPRSFNLLFDNSDCTVGCHLWLAFWQEFDRFLQEWYSRIHFVSEPPRDVKYFTTWLNQEHVLSSRLLDSAVRVVRQQMISRSLVP
jgi:hypothetical protein